MNKSRPKSTSFVPNQNNMGGRTQITQQMYNHYNRLYSVKSTINPEARPLKKAESRVRTSQVPVQPYSKEALYQRAQQIEKKPVMMHNGISLDQWKTINSFSIVGQSNKKKANFNTAIDHFFNLRAMYRKINQAKLRPSKEKGSLVFKKKTVSNVKTTSNLAHAFVVNAKVQEEPRSDRVVKKQTKSKSLAKVADKPKASLKKQSVKREKIGNVNPQDKNRISKLTEEDDEELMDLENTHEQALINDNVNRAHQLNNDTSDEDQVDDENEDSDMKALAELQAKIPQIDKKSSADELDEFKQAIVQLIFEYEIFNEEDFEKFFELCCLKCSQYDTKDMETLFDEVKLYLYEQLKGDIEDDVE